MRNLKAIWLLFFGIVLSIGAQYLGGLVYSYLPVSFIEHDPALFILYTSLGLIITFLCAAYALSRRVYLLAVGILLGLMLWWPFLFIGMSASGTWL